MPVNHSNPATISGSPHSFAAVSTAKSSAAVSLDTRYRLRRKLDPDGTLQPIETLRGRGYRFRKEET